MTGEMLKELNELRKELEINDYMFESILAYGYMYQRDSDQYISPELLCEIIAEALNRADNTLIYKEFDKEKEEKNRKSAKQAFNEALKVFDFHQIKTK